MSNRSGSKVRSNRERKINLTRKKNTLVSKEDGEREAMEKRI